MHNSLDVPYPDCGTPSSSWPGPAAGSARPPRAGSAPPGRRSSWSDGARTRCSRWPPRSPRPAARRCACRPTWPVQTSTHW